MNRVGEKLAAIAIQSGNADETDLFGRSAINRFYYACFLDARRAVLRIRPDLRILHKQFPTDLKGKIADTVRREISLLEKRSLISSREATTYRTTLLIAVSALSEILAKAYKLRVTADYEPDTKAVKAGAHIILSGTSNTVAKDWHRQTGHCVARIMKLWSDLGQP